MSNYFAAPWAVVRQAALGGILQARTLEWVAIPFSRGSSRPRDRTQVSCIGRGILDHCATMEVHVGRHTHVYMCALTCAYSYTCIIFVYILTYTYMCACLHILTNRGTCANLHVHIYVSYTCIYSGVRVHFYLNVYICTYLNMHILIYT